MIPITQYLLTHTTALELVRREANATEDRFILRMKIACCYCCIDSMKDDIKRVGSGMLLALYRAPFWSLVLVLVEM